MKALALALSCVAVLPVANTGHAEDANPTPPAVYDAVMSEDAQLLDLMLAAHETPNCVTYEGDTPLCAALRKGSLDLVTALLKAGADASSPGYQGYTPLAFACLWSRPGLLKLLLDAGADPNGRIGPVPAPDMMRHVQDPDFRGTLRSERGFTPLMVCAARGDVDGVALLLSHGADTELHTLPNYRYPMDFAAERHHISVMRLLTGRGPDSEPHVLISVNLSTQRAALKVDGKTTISTDISTGRKGFDTPAGHYMITNKYEEWMSTVYKVPMPFFMRLNCSAIGLHSGYVTGSPASHGCVRLPPGIAKKFFSITNVGDEVIIHD